MADLEWHFTDDRPIYAQLVEGLQLAIVTGVYPPGGRLPGVRELAAEAGVNPNTMQRALAELEGSGLVHTRRTSGRFITEDTARIRAQREALADGIVQAFIRDMRALGFTPADIRTLVAAGSKAEEENYHEQDDS